MYLKALEARSYGFTFVVDSDNWCELRFDIGDDYMSLRIREYGSATELTSTSVDDLSVDTWYRTEADFYFYEINFRAYELDGTELGDVTATDNTYSDGQFGFWSDDGDVLFNNITRRPL